MEHPQNNLVSPNYAASSPKDVMTEITPQYKFTAESDGGLLAMTLISMGRIVQENMNDISYLKITREEYFKEWQSAKARNATLISDFNKLYSENIKLGNDLKSALGTIATLTEEIKVEKGRVESRERYLQNSTADIDTLQHTIRSLRRELKSKKKK